jgi:hypothetical protein
MRCSCITVGWIWMAKPFVCRSWYRVPNSFLRFPVRSNEQRLEQPQPVTSGEIIFWASKGVPRTRRQEI